MSMGPTTRFNGRLQVSVALFLAFVSVANGSAVSARATRGAITRQAAKAASRSDTLKSNARKPISTMKTQRFSAGSDIVRSPVRLQMGTTTTSSDDSKKSTLSAGVQSMYWWGYGSDNSRYARRRDDDDAMVLFSQFMDSYRSADRRAKRDMLYDLGSSLDAVARSYGRPLRMEGRYGQQYYYPTEERYMRDRYGRDRYQRDRYGREYRQQYSFPNERYNRDYYERDRYGREYDRYGQGYQYRSDRYYGGQTGRSPLALPSEIHRDQRYGRNSGYNFGNNYNQNYYGNQWGDDRRYGYRGSSWY